MLRVLFDKKMSNIGGMLKVAPGVFIQDPKTLNKDVISQAKLLNETLALLTPYLTQFYYKDDELNKAPALAGISAILLRPDNDGHIYLVGNRNNERVLTDLLVNQLEADLAVLIKPIRAFTKKNDNHDISVDKTLTSVFLNFNNLAEIDEYELASTNKKVSRLHIQKPEYAVLEMLTASEVNTNALLAALYLAGVNLDNFTPEAVRKALSNAVKNTSVFQTHPESQERLDKLLSRIDKGLKTHERFRSIIKEAVIQVLSRNWVDCRSVYDIYWSEHHIGSLSKLGVCKDISLLKPIIDSGSEQSWAISTVKQVQGYQIPNIFPCVTPFFPQTVRSLLPERVSPEAKKIPAYLYHEELMKKKPYALGNLYFHNRTGGTQPKNQRSFIQVSLDDVSDGLIFSPEQSNIDLQDVDSFKSFAFEVGNLGSAISIPGFQLKAPANISIHRGKTVLKFAEPEEFSHIIKFPNSERDKTGMVYAEIFGMAAASAMGVNTAKFRAVRTSSEMVKGIVPNIRASKVDEIISTGEPAYITELFDRPLEGDKTLFFNEDFLSASKCIDKYETNSRILDEHGSLDRCLFSKESDVIPTSSVFKYHGVDTLTAILKARSTNWDEDSKLLFKNILANTLVGNGDGHLKNFSILHRSTPDGRIEARLSPAYDIVATRSYYAKGFDHDFVCLFGRSYTPTRNEIINDGVEHFGFSREQTEQLLDETLDKAHKFAFNMTLSPDIYNVFNNTKMGRDIFHRAIIYMKGQINVLSSNNNNHDVRLDEDVIFQQMYPGCQREANIGLDFGEFQLLKAPTQNPDENTGIMEHASKQGEFSTANNEVDSVLHQEASLKL